MIIEADRRPLRHRDANAFRLDNELFDHIRWVLQASAKDEDASPYMKCLRSEVSEKELTAVCTDGHRVHYWKIAREGIIRATFPETAIYRPIKVNSTRMELHQTDPANYKFPNWKSVLPDASKYHEICTARALEREGGNLPDDYFAGAAVGRLIGAYVQRTFAATGHVEPINVSFLLQLYQYGHDAWRMKVADRFQDPEDVAVLLERQEQEHGQSTAVLMPMRGLPVGGVPAADDL